MSLRGAAATGVWIATAAAALAAPPPAASGRPSTLTMSCAQAQALVRSRGSVLLSTGAHRFDRYVSGYLYCATSEYPYTRSVPTADSPACPIGYVCADRVPEWLLNRH